MKLTRIRDAYYILLHDVYYILQRELGLVWIQIHKYIIYQCTAFD